MTSLLLPPGVDSPVLRDKRHTRARAAGEVAEWLDWRELEGKAPRTLEDSERITAALLRANMGKTLAELTEADLSAFLRDVPTASRRKVRSHLAALFGWAYRMDRIERNPLDRVPSFPRVPQRVVPTFSDGEIAALEELPTPDGPLFSILFDAGLRASECRALQVKHVVFDRSYIVILKGKGRKDRVIPMTRRLASRLADWFLFDALEREDYLWYSRPGGHHIQRRRPITPTSLKLWYRRSIEDAGITYRNLHATRHTFATRCLRSGISITAVSRLMGHASIKTTADAYAHLAVEDLAAELELLELA